MNVIRLSRDPLTLIAEELVRIGLGQDKLDQQSYWCVDLPSANKKRVRIFNDRLEWIGSPELLFTMLKTCPDDGGLMELKNRLDLAGASIWVKERGRKPPYPREEDADA